MVLGCKLPQEGIGIVVVNSEDALAVAKSFLAAVAVPRPGEDPREIVGVWGSVVARVNIAGPNGAPAPERISNSTAYKVSRSKFDRQVVCAVGRQRASW